MVRQPHAQRLQPPCGAADPVRQGRTAEVDSLAGEDLRLAVQRKVVAVLADQHVSQQPRACEPLCYRPLGRRCLMDRAAGAAAVLRAVDAHDAKLRWHPVEHLARRLADRVKAAATVGALIAVYVENDVRARQMVGKRRASWRGCGTGIVRRRHRLTGFQMGDNGVELFEPEGELIGVKALGPPSELPSLKLLNDALETFYFVITCLDGDRHIAHQTVQKADVGRQVLKIEAHERF